eukprot:TRINITY_DN29814_c0_g1_i1.p1 TRINITY_DN29814_c0_g1~~TRINITY_DN29814_c0_g1_i1.p1  ORF type:complete len:354 (+),score=49.46 TRINITY_DN29814_c0_g1_i1:50-1111(+)
MWSLYHASAPPPPYRGYPQGKAESFAESMSPSLPTCSSSLTPRRRNSKSSSSAQTLHAYKSGVRRDHSQVFGEARERHLKYLMELRANSNQETRLEWFDDILSSGDAEQTAAFIKVARDACRREPKPGEVCKWCNARISLSSSDAKAATSGVSLARTCQICLSWHCVKCCSFVVRIGYGGSQAVEMSCCETCHRAIDIQRWRKDLPPAGLSDSSKQLMEGHEKLALALTSFATVLAQFEGLSRGLEEMQGYSSEDTVVSSAKEACSEALVNGLRESRLAEVAATVQARLQQIQAIDCESSGGPQDSKLREALVTHGKQQIEVLRPRMRQFSARCKDLIPLLSSPKASPLCSPR